MRFEQTTVTVERTKQQIRDSVSEFDYDDEDDMIYVRFCFKPGITADFRMKVPVNVPVGRAITGKKHTRLMEKRRMTAWRSVYWLIKNALHMEENNIKMQKRHPRPVS